MIRDIINKINMCLKSLFFHKQIGAIDNGALYSSTLCNGSYILEIHDDDFDSSFQIGGEYTTHLEVVHLSGFIPWDYPNTDVNFEEVKKDWERMNR